MDNLIYKYAENDWMKKIILQRDSFFNYIMEFHIHPSYHQF